MNALAELHNAIPAFAMPEEELMEVLENSVYPGASRSSIKLVINYCKAGGLDPLQKVVHIVPMTVTVGKDEKGWDIKKKRDVLMPGIDLYRVRASRTGQYLGCSEPVFGPMKKLSFQREVWEDGANDRRVKRLIDSEIEYPEWCSVTVRRSVNGTIAEFTAREFWQENYASQNANSIAPNSMWCKRIMGQIAKCAEAQALRKGFPEVGAQPTYEEMAGKLIDINSDVIDADAPEVKTPQIEHYPSEKFELNLPTWTELVKSEKKSPEQIIAMVNSKQPLSDEQQKRIRDLAKKPATTSDQPESAWEE